MSEDIIAQCAWCKKIRLSGKWVDVKLPEGVEVTHGICEPCARKLHEDEGISDDDLVPDENPDDYPADSVEADFHSHPMHGWIDPEGSFHFTKGHSRWAHEQLQEKVPTLKKSADPWTEAHFLLLWRGWVALGPGYAMVAERMTKKQIEKISAMIIEHAPKEVMGQPFFIDIMKERLAVKGIWITHQEMINSNTWGMIMKRAHDAD